MSFNTSRRTFAQYSKSEGTDANLLKALKAALAKAGATFEIIAPHVTGAKASEL